MGQHLQQMPQMTKISDIPIASYKQLEEQYGNDIDKICNNHEKLVELILEEEEELISGHRQHIDDVVDVVKQVSTALYLFNVGRK